MNSFPFFRFPYNNYYRYYNCRNNLNKNTLYSNCNPDIKQAFQPPYVENKNIGNNVEKNNNYINETTNICNYRNNDYKKLNTDFENTNNQNNNISKKNKSSKFYLGPIVFDSSSFSDLEKPVLELLGLKLYLDDILILSLLYFLYEEDVKDETLFISLLLLLIS